MDQKTNMYIKHKINICTKVHNKTHRNTADDMLSLRNFYVYFIILWSHKAT